MSCTKITSMRSSAIRAAKTTAASRKCSSATQSSTPVWGHYYEMEKYYYAIPKEEILRSPSLMCGMSMLTSLCMDYEASEMWYSALQEYAAPLKKTDTAYKDGCAASLHISISPSRSAAAKASQRTSATISKF